MNLARSAAQENIKRELLQWLESRYAYHDPDSRTLVLFWNKEVTESWPKEDSDLCATIRQRADFLELLEKVESVVVDSDEVFCRFDARELLAELKAD